MSDIYARYRTCRNLCEVGVGAAEDSQLRPWINSGEYDSIVMVEALRRHYENLVAAFGVMKGIRIIHGAICDQPGEVVIVDHTGSSYVKGIRGCSALCNPELARRESSFRTEISSAVHAAEIDDGRIELLCADCEGSEWFMLRDMISRPKAIKLELRYGGYVNPYDAEIRAWLSREKYISVQSWTDGDELFERQIVQ